ncbi:MAG: ribosome maturation factor RimM [Candidatus Dormibacterales bacterium]
MTEAGTPARLRVGQVAGAFGVGGAFRVLPLTDFGDRFEAGSELLLGGARRRVEWARRARDRLVVKLEGTDDRAAAERERGRYLEVPSSGARPLPAGSFYHHQLVGLEVRTASGRRLGRLASVLPRPANDVWVARTEEGSERLLPATREAVVAVDLEGGSVVVADWLVAGEGS